ncbi:MAG: hypothetical protein EOO68_40445 [Moraxellaceae bacterium]|nr:MAG: hypothetical protein EOO68_40445 [Moraxellaceae bacterium]
MNHHKFHYTFYGMLGLILLISVLGFNYHTLSKEVASGSAIIYEYDRGHEACYILEHNQQQRYISCPSAKSAEN